MLLQLLAAKIFDSHLQNRHQLTEPPLSDRRGLGIDDAILLDRAMAAAAHADGRLDADERPSEGLLNARLFSFGIDEVLPADCSFSPVAHSKLRENPPDVCLDRGQRHAEFISDLLVGLAAYQMSEHLDLPRR